MKVFFFYNLDKPSSRKLRKLNWKLAISFSGILCPTDFLMIEIIYDHRMPLWDSAIRHFIIHKWAIILFSHFLSFYFKCFKVAAVMLVIDLIVKWYKIRMFSGNIIHNCLFETASKIEIFEPEQIALILYLLKDCFKIRDTGEYWGYEANCTDTCLMPRRPLPARRAGSRGRDRRLRPG